MNTGIQDAYNLAWKIGLVRAGKASNALLTTYDAERSPVAATVLKETDMLTRMVELQHPMLRGLRNRLLPLIASRPSFQARMAPQMAQLAFHYRRSSIVAEDWSGSNGAAPRAGDRAPDAAVRRGSDAEAMQLFDVLRGTNHVLLLFSGEKPETGKLQELRALGASIQSQWRGLLSVYLVSTEASLPANINGDGPTVVVDPELACHVQYGTRQPSLYLIRPDMYIGYRARPVQRDALQRYLSGIFSP